MIIGLPTPYRCQCIRYQLMQGFCTAVSAREVKTIELQRRWTCWDVIRPLSLVVQVLQGEGGHYFQVPKGSTL